MKPRNPAGHEHQKGGDWMLFSYFALFLLQIYQLLSNKSILHRTPEPYHPSPRPLRARRHHADGPHGFHRPRQAQQNHLIGRSTCVAPDRILDHGGNDGGWEEVPQGQVRGEGIRIRSWHIQQFDRIPLPSC